MFNFLKCCFFFLITLHVTGQNCLPRLKKGNWSGNLQLNENSRLPFKFVIAKKNKTFVFTIFNGEEKITLIQDQITKDSLKLSFPLFNSTLFLNIKSNSLISGYWQNLNKGVNYKIPCDLTSFSKTSHSSPLDPVNFGGKCGKKGHKKTVKHDNIKSKYCIINNIPLLVIPYWEFDNIETLIKNFLKNIQEI